MTSPTITLGEPLFVVKDATREVTVLGDLRAEEGPDGRQSPMAFGFRAALARRAAS